MKVREVLMLKKHDLNDGSGGLNGSRFNSVPLDQIRPSNRMAGRREQMASHGIPAAANPDNVPGIEPPRLGRHQANEACANFHSAQTGS